MDNETPNIFYSSLSEVLNIELNVKHDDLYPFIGGGSKARKIRYILRDAVKRNSNALVSAGASNSNHARVVALAGAQKGWPVKLIIHDVEDYSNGNLLLMKMAGADMIFVEKSDVSNAMDQAMSELKRKGYNPYYIWGGGHTVYGMEAYYKAVIEFKNQAGNWTPDYVFHASGTGGTQVGLHVGFEKFYSSTKVVGVSVARKEDRGKIVVEQGVMELKDFLKISKGNNDVIFKDRWIRNGYGSIYPELTDIIQKAAGYGLITDPTYTGKALLALSDMCKAGEVEPGSKVLFWHTGGLINLLKEYKRFL